MFPRKSGQQIPDRSQASRGKGKIRDYTLVIIQSSSRPRGGGGKRKRKRGRKQERKRASRYSKHSFECPFPKLPQRSSPSTKYQCTALR